MASSHDRVLEDSLCKVFAEMRRKAGVDQQEVADHLGVSRVAVWNWENGIAFPRVLANLQRWAAVLGGKVEFRVTTKDGDEFTF